MEEKSLISIISTAVITALIVGGVVYSIQNSKSKNLQKDIDDLKTQVQTSQLALPNQDETQAQNNQEMQNTISDLQNKIADLQNKTVENENKETEIKDPELTKKTVLSLLKNDLPSYLEDPSSGNVCISNGLEGGYGTCDVSIFKTNDQWNVEVTYDKLADDSIRATRVKAAITNKNGKWIKGSVSKDQKCQPNRGHQDFSTALCI